MCDLDHAIALNNEGVLALWTGDEDKAISLMTRSLQALREDTPSLPPPKPTNAAQSANATAVTPSSSSQNSVTESSQDQFGPDLSYPFVRLPEQDEYLPLMEGDVNASSVIPFEQAMAIPHALSCGPLDCPLCKQKDILVYTIVILFNVALSHQRKYKKVEDAQIAEDCNLKAEKLYRIVLGTDLLLDGSSTDHTAIGLIIKLASINNLLEIRPDQGVHDLVFEGLVKDVYAILQTSRIVVEHPLFQVPDIQYLLLHGFVLQEFGHKILPGAA